MIDIKKTYKTRDGREVRIYAIDGGGQFPVHGSVKNNSGTAWSPNEWTETGSNLGYPEFRIHGLDLIEVKHRIKREVWLNVHKDRCTVRKTKKTADLLAGPHPRLACVKITIDCEEGDGL